MKDADNWTITSQVQSGIVCGKPTSIAVIQFKDKYLIVVTECGKIGSLVEVMFETTGADKLCNSKVIFGRDESEIHAVACALTETCKFNKPVIFGFSLRDYTVSIVKELREIIMKLIDEPPKQESHAVNIVP